VIVVVADASPLRYLVSIGEADVLSKLYGRVLIPATVAAELTQARTPGPVRQWIARCPAWLSIVETATTVPITADLDPGERDAILLAVERKADLVLMDDREGVDEARRQGLAVIGTLGVLDRAAEKGFVDLAEAVARLRETNFRASRALLDLLLAQDHERRSGGGAENV